MTWEAYALRYAEDTGRRAFQCFLGGTGGDGPMPIAYHAFLLRGPDGAWVAMDTGAAPDRIARYGKAPVGQGIAAAMAALGGPGPDAVRTVIQTHLHWDHAGQSGLFPAARFHLRRREMAYATGPAMRHAALRAGYETQDIAAATELLHQGRLVLHGDAEGTLAPGLALHHVGGHTDGLQIATVETRRGRLVLATDAVAHRANLERRIPFPVLYHVGDALDAFETVERLAGGDASRIIPGHDPWVVQAHPAAGPGLDGWIARLD
jgi:glyoxylase-like metal-dependent hydrolase (beta-lactamase superfamily II)